MAARLCDAGALRHIGEGTVAIVAVQQIGSAFQPARAAHHGDAFPLAVLVAARLWNGFLVEDDVVGDEQVEIAVTIVIEKRATGPPAPARCRKAGLLGPVFERPVPLVAIEHVVSEVGHQQIGVPVVVVIGGADALTPARAGQTSPPGDILKRAVSLIAIEVIDRLFPWRKAFRPAAVGKENIPEAVAVEIKDGNAGPRGLENVLLLLLTTLNDSGDESRPCGDVFKLDFGSRCPPLRGLPGVMLRKEQNTENATREHEPCVCHRSVRRSGHARNYSGSGSQFMRPLTL